jgi:hypothetical protein
MPPRRSSQPVSLGKATDLAKDIAAMLGQLTGGEYGQPALAELEAGERLVDENLGNPVAFAHTVMDSYALAAGDLLYGASETARQKHNLAFSSGAVARAACEYAGLGWWLAEPGISVEARIARTARLVNKSLAEARGLLDSAEQSRFQTENHVLLTWAGKNLSRRETVPGPTDRFVAMNPDHGKRSYAYFSLLAHGDLISTVRIVAMQQASNGEPEEDQVWRLMLACAHVLNLATRLSDLRDRRPADLISLFGLHQRYSDAMDAELSDQ